MKERELSILFFLNSLSLGGAERATVNLANYWAGKNWEVTIVTLDSKSLDFYEIHPSIKRIALDISGNSSNCINAIFKNIYRIFVLRRLLKQIKPDIALAMMSTANILLALASIYLKKIITVGSERTFPPKVPLGRIWESLRTTFYNCLSVVVALNQESALWLAQNTKSRKINIIPNSISFPLPSTEPHIDISIIPKGKKKLISVGRLSEEKQFDILISVFQKLIFDFPDWVLVILGEGNIRYQLEKQIKSLKIENHVFLPGNTGNIGEWYASADIYVLTSRYEGFPNSLVEAMAYGLPVISFDCDTGPRNIIRNGIDGLLVQAENVDELVKALQRLMKNENLRKRFSKRATEVRERYSQEKILCMWEELFDDLIE